MKKLIFLAILAAAVLAPLMADGGNIDYLNDDNFYEVTAGEIYVVDFYADWCGPCRAFAPTFEEVANSLPEYRFGKVDVDVSYSLSTDFNIMYIPFIAAIQDGEVIAQYEGNRTANDFKRWVETVNSQGGSSSDGRRSRRK